MHEDESGPVVVDEAFSVGTVAAEMRAKQGAMDGAGASAGRAVRRIPILTLVVVAIGAYFLVDLYRDFAYWLEPGKPRDLQTASALFADGRVPPDNQYASVQGSPNRDQLVSVAQRELSTDYFPLRGTDAKLWAAVSRDTPDVPAYAEGAYIGRLQGFAKLEEFAHVRQVLKASDLATTVDTTPAALLAFLGGGGGGLDPRPEDRIHIVVTEPDATVQVGKRTFPKMETAQGLVAELGYPVVALPRDKQPYHTFVARIPAAERDGAQTRLRSSLPAGTVGASPSHGAQILQRTAVHKAAVKDVALDGATVTLPFDAAKASPGYELSGDQLVQRPITRNRLAVPTSLITKVRLERPVVIPEGASVLEVGAVPGNETPRAILWLLIVLVMLGVAIVPTVQSRFRHRDAEI